MPRRHSRPRAPSHIPPAISTRFKKTAKHLGIGLEELESILDFSVDPFTLRAVTLPGKKTAEKTRQVALLAASRSYLATGLWSADWQEVKSLCVDHNCYDIANHALIVKRAASKLFKGAEAGKPIELPSGGIQAAERLLKGLSEPAT